MRKALYWVLIGIFALIFLISSFIVVDYFIDADDSQDQWANISNQFDDTQPTTSAAGTTTGANNATNNGANNSTTGTTGTNGATVPATQPTVPPTTVPPTTLPEATDPAHVHTYSENVVAPTCTVGGYTAYVCGCGVFYRENEVGPNGHSYGTWQYGKYADDDYERPRTRECVVCKATQTQKVLSRFTWSLKNNEDVVGYIRVVNDPDKDPDDKKYYLINYPILHRPTERDYYLYRNFYGQEDKHGAIYLRESCNMFEPTDVLTIYGHNMSDGSMFAGLHKYLTKSYFNSHQYITVWDLYEEHTYQVVCIFRTSGTYGVGFPFHLFDNFADEAEYLEFINGARDLAIYDTGIETQYGDQFICLCTCEYTINNGRLGLLAKRLS